MKTLTQLLEADQQNQDNNNNNDQGNNNQQDNKNKSVKMDAGTYKQWPAFNTTVKGWIKVMSGQEEAKDSFFDGGFLVPTTIQGFAGNTQSKTATLSKQLDNTCKVVVAEFSNDYMFLIDGIKPYGYVSTGWTKGKGPAIADVIKSMKAEAQTKEETNKEGNDNGNNDNGNSGTM